MSGRHRDRSKLGKLDAEARSARRQLVEERELQLVGALVFARGDDLVLLCGRVVSPVA